MSNETLLSPEQDDRNLSYIPPDDINANKIAPPIFNSIKTNMPTVLHKNQKNVANIIFKDLKTIIENNKESDFKCERVFKAPTGAGKTKIISNVIRDIHKTEDKILCIVITPGNGELEEQTYKSFVQDGHKASLLTPTDKEFLRTLHTKLSVLITSWNYLNRIDGPFYNSSENSYSVVEILDNLKRHGTKVILFIDECHHFLTEKAERIIDAINPICTVKLSATPYVDKKGNIISGHIDYELTIHQIIEDGLIKKTIEINKDDDANNNNDDDSIKRCLRKAFEHHKNILSSILSCYCKKYGYRLILPLIIINIPDGKFGNEYLKIIKEFFAEYNITIDNGNMAIWLDDNKFRSPKEVLVNLSDEDSKVEILVTKQAIREGWDCPRAWTLVHFRDSGTAITIQTIGRIMRLLYATPFPPEFEALNHAYLYTNADNISIDQAISQYAVVQNNKITTELKEGVPRIELPNTLLDTVNNIRDIGSNYRDEYLCNYLKAKYSVEKDMVELNRELLEEAGFSFDLSYKTHQLAYNKIDINDVYSQRSDINGVQDEVQGDKFALEKDINEFIKNNVHVALSTTHLVSRIKRQLYGYFNNRLLNFTTEEFYKFILNNKEKFSILLQTTTDDYIDNRERLPKKETNIVSWTFPIYKKYNLDFCVEHFEYTKDIYNKCYRKKDGTGTQERRETEQLLDNFLNENTCVRWIYKNSDSGSDALGIPYKRGNNIERFCIDYVTILKNNRIALIEAKNATGGDEYVREKHACLVKYKLDNKILGGIVVYYNGRHMINVSDGEYRYIADNPGDWLDFNKWLEINGE